jgi:hypothetical protein
MDSRKPRCAVLVASCDSYKDLWDPFFRLMQIYWRDIPYPVYLNTETESFQSSQYGLDVRVLNLEPKHKVKKVAWGGRMMSVLERIPEEYVLLMVEDFFIRDHVRTDLIEKIIDLMEADPTIASFQLSGTGSHVDLPVLERGKLPFSYHLIPKDGWRTHFRPTVWRKSILLKWLRPFESIWGFEAHGSKRAIRWKYKEKVYVVDAPPIIDYAWFVNKCECSAVVHGRWFDHPGLRELFEGNDIKVDYERRGFITEEEYMRRASAFQILRRYRFWQIPIKCLNYIRSMY